MISAADRPKNVLITGCSAGGAGSALAEEFNQRGLHVFATARSLSKMSHLAKRPMITLLELDVTSTSSIAAAVAAVSTTTGGKLDYLVNNSGQACVRPALDTELEYARGLFDVNFWGSVNTIHAFSPLIIASGGTIVNVCSIAAVLSVPWGSFYNASKAAIKSYGEALRLEMAPLGVNVMTIMTGIIGTNIFANHPVNKLPEGSLWEAASEDIMKNASGEGLLDTSMPPGLFAERVVDDVLGGVNGLTWRGKMSSIAWFLSTFLPTWLLSGADRIV
ncbi:hypothetical protein N7495_000083 [Penicillium taxi]|uniref:uncharacterized protein n=1 Tax=Penicillium taxi TaxID=168475 RepID=UPI002545B234|nr:uncharacterized protein N7495_000083 [Penicillium taxi]KAJ5907401.1 hypothetical protein N7495_000083 [Penicillium taxi]